MTDKTSLLPAHLSELERDLDAALARIDDVEIPIATLWNPWECPLDALPYLAWAMSVDLWRSDWSERAKRQVVADSLKIHRIKGTRPAVEMAIGAARGDEVRLVEWFEDRENLEKGTFRVDVKSIEQEIDISELQQLVPIINQAKNTRSHLVGITVTSRIEAKEKYIGISRQGIRSRSGPWLINSVISSSSNCMASVSRMAVQVCSGPLELILE
ncbi:phage tail protein I [Vibrio owensii]|uniref:phage tail protein I n=1 Tax=Vibrio owensii TaxID=696485 RepID=UPI0037495210